MEDKLTKFGEWFEHKMRTNFIEVFLTNLINRIHYNLNFYRSVYVLIGFVIILGGGNYLINNIDVNSNDFWILVIITSFIGALFIAVGIYAQDKEE